MTNIRTLALWLMAVTMMCMAWAPTYVVSAPVSDVVTDNNAEEMNNDDLVHALEELGLDLGIQTVEEAADALISRVDFEDIAEYDFPLKQLEDNNLQTTVAQTICIIAINKVVGAGKAKTCVAVCAKAGAAIAIAGAGNPITTAIATAFGLACFPKCQQFAKLIVKDPTLFATKICESVIKF